MPMWAWYQKVPGSSTVKDWTVVDIGGMGQDEKEVEPSAKGVPVWAMPW